MSAKHVLSSHWDKDTCSLGCCEREAGRVSGDQLLALVLLIHRELLGLGFPHCKMEKMPPALATMGRGALLGWAGR